MLANATIKDALLGDITYVQRTIMFASLKTPLATAEATRRQHQSSTFTEPLHVSDARQQELKEFLADFYKTIYHKQNELSRLLEENTVLRQQYQTLVVQKKQVAHEDFWQRYYWRCDPHHILAEWHVKDLERAAARSEYIAGGLARVQKILHHVNATPHDDGGTTSGVGESEKNVPPPSHDAVDDFLETKKSSKDGVDDFLASGPIEGEEPLVFWNKNDEDDEQKESGRKPLITKKSVSHKAPKRVSFAENESESIEPGVDKSRKGPSAEDRAVVSHVQVSHEENDEKVQPPTNQPASAQDNDKSNIDAPTPSVEKPLLPKTSTIRSGPSDDKKSGGNETQRKKDEPVVVEKPLAVKALTTTPLSDDNQSDDKAETTRKEKARKVKASLTAEGLDANDGKPSSDEAFASIMKEESTVAATLPDAFNIDKVSASDNALNYTETKSGLEIDETLPATKASIPLKNQGDETRTVAQTKPSFVENLIHAKKTSVEREDNKNTGTIESVTESLTKHTRDYSIGNAKVKHVPAVAAVKRGSKVNQLRSMFESTSSDVRNSSRNMKSQSSNQSVAAAAKMPTQAPILRSWNRDTVSDINTAPMVNDDKKDRVTVSSRGANISKSGGKDDQNSSKQQAKGEPKPAGKKRPVARMLRAWKKSRTSKKTSKVDAGDDGIKGVPSGEEALDATRSPRSAVTDDSPTHPEQIKDTKDPIDTGKDETDTLEQNINKLQWATIASSMLVAITIGLIMFSTPVLDGLCAPAFPSHKLDMSDNVAYLEAPWWVPSPYKASIFSVLCGGHRKRTVLEWVPSDKKKTDFHRLVVRVVEGDRMEVIRRDKKRLSSSCLYAQHIVTVDQSGSTEDIPAPWAFDLQDE